MRARFAATFVALAAAVVLAMNSACAEPRAEIKGAFSKFVAAQNAHDLKAVGELISVSPDFLWISPGHVVRGRAAALDRFAELFQGTWRVDPEWSTFQIMMLDVSTAEIFVRVSTTDGARAQSTQMNQIMVNTARGWHVMSILPGDPPPN